MTCDLNTAYALPPEANWQPGSTVHGNHEMFGSFNAETGEFTFTRTGMATFLVYTNGVTAQVQLTGVDHGTVPVEPVAITPLAAVFAPSTPDRETQTVTADDVASAGELFGFTEPTDEA